MVISNYTAFLGIAALVIVTPGQDTALVVRNTLAGGRRTGIRTAVGVVAGQACWTIGAGAGLTAVLLASATAFEILRWIGAGYLVFLGIRSLLIALRGGQGEAPYGIDTGGGHPTVALRQGWLSALSNPKLAAFFAGLFPPFVPAGAGAPVALAVLGATFCGMTFAWLTLYALAVERAGRALGGNRVRRALEAVLGVTLVALGLRLASERR